MYSLRLCFALIVLALPSLGLANVCRLDGSSPMPCRPPQFVNINFDGSYNLAIWHDLMNFADSHNAKFTFYVSGVTFLHRGITDKNHPLSKNHYVTPGYEARSGRKGEGRSRVLWARNGSESATTTSTLAQYKRFGIGQDDQTAQIQARYITMMDTLKRGHEVGSHGNGHFYGGSPNRVSPLYENATSGQRKRNEFAFNWSTSEWDFEFAQFKNFVIEGISRAQLPEKIFGHELKDWAWALDAQISGFRAPYLSVNSQLNTSLINSNYNYDASRISSSHLLWPKRSPEGLWIYPIPMVKVPGYKKKVLGMDFNFQVSNVSEEKAYQAWKNAFLANYNGNRSPLTLGMHVYRMGPKNGSSPKGAYLRAMKRLVREVCQLPEVICGTYNQLTTFLEKYENQVQAFENGLFLDTAQLAENPLRKSSLDSRTPFLLKGPASENQLRGFEPPEDQGVTPEVLLHQDCSKFHQEDDILGTAI